MATITYTLDQPAGLTQVLAEITGTQTMTYLYSLTRISQQTSAGTQYFLDDGLGSVRELVDGAGNVVLVNRYEPFGRQISSTGAVQSNYGFAAEYLDANQLYYLRARYYQPSRGRFIQKDSWAGSYINLADAGGSYVGSGTGQVSTGELSPDYTRPQSLNGWAYGEGNPVNRTDPSGHCAQFLAAGPVGVVAAGTCIVIIAGVVYFVVLPASQYLIANSSEIAREILNGCDQVKVDANQFARDLLNGELPDTQPVPVGPDIIIQPQPTATPVPEYVYRDGKRVKDLSLHRVRDWETGLSFWDSPHPGPEIKFRVSVLEANGYVVRPDGNTPVMKLWGQGQYIEPNSGQQVVFPPGHVTVYHSNQLYWDAWHQADLANLNTPRVSDQLNAISQLREP